MPKLNSTLSTFLIAAMISGGMTAMLAWNQLQVAHAEGPVVVAQAGTDGGDGAVKPKWAASATGRIEPKSGPVRIAPQISGRITNILVDTNDVVKEGDLLLTLDPEDYQSRIRAAKAEADVRLLERGEEPVTGIALDRQKAVDNAASVERELFEAWRELDQMTLDLAEGRGNRTDIDRAHDKIKSLRSKLTSARDEVARLNDNPDMPLENRLETSLAVARAELAMAENAFERTRIRAPFDGTVLNVYAKIGEIAAPSPQSALVAFGDVSKLKVRAEVEERDVAKVRIGQKVVVQADAFPDREFEGVVTEIASALGSPRITSRGPRRPNDVDVLEVVATLEGTPPLLTGMRVDVFFKPLNRGDQSAAR